MRAAPGLLITLLLASDAVSANPPLDWQVGLNLGAAQTVILVHVVESTFPPEVHSPDVFAHATVLVLKSWKGPFSTGRELQVAPPGGCAGSTCLPYPLQAGDDLLIFTQATAEPIFAMQGFVWRAVESQAAITALDQAVKEQLELQDPQTDVMRGPERTRVMLALNRCFAEASAYPNDEYRYARCQAMDVSVLRGIKRSELVANWGPPTWCQRFNPPGTTAYVPPVGADCPPEEVPIWSFGHRSSPGSGLWCNAERNLRCMGITWISVGGG